MAAPSKYEITTTMLQNTFVHKFFLSGNIRIRRI